ncbi:helix-turn-helix domain-containing protein [Dethiothermospora halolimnae]|uniref:helix-turn-helix domain-containing protein n=1 Tax=Dethiothermospora halolimnae TaxID=3114390 RepID=UPI003CCC2CE6
MNLVKLGNLLKDKRNQMGLSLRDASKLIGISHNYLSIIEKAKDPRSESPIKPTIDTLKMISDAYNLNINNLLELAGYEDIVIEKVKYRDNNKQDVEKIADEILDYFYESGDITEEEKKTGKLSPEKRKQLYKTFKVALDMYKNFYND